MRSALPRGPPLRSRRANGSAEAIAWITSDEDLNPLLMKFDWAG